MNNTNEDDFIEWSKITPNLQGNIFTDSKIKDMVRQLKTIIPNKLNELDNTTENSNLFNEINMTVLNTLKKRFSKKSDSDLYKWDWNNNGHGFGSASLGRYVKFLEGNNTKSDMIENVSQNFYGLWMPRNNQDKIDKCLHSGIWYRGDGNYDKEEEARKIASMSTGDKVFLYYLSNDVKEKDSPFAQYLPDEQLAREETIVKAKCVGVGKIVNTNTNDLSVTVDWDEDYQGSEWYLYTRQDGVWWFDGKTQDKKKSQALYDIVFNGKEQDYKWWVENGGYYNMSTITGSGSNINPNNRIKNIILYGSPGVGKTHNTNKLIKLIESGIPEKEIFETIKSNEQNNGMNITDIKDRVKFVTFHQSFGYEDFIEGYRPNDDGKIELEDGIFKRIAIQANENLLKSNENNMVLFNDAINFLLKKKIENEEFVNINMKRENSFYKIYDYNDKTLYFEKQNGGRSHTLSLRTLEQMYDAEENNIIHGGLAPYYNPLLEELLEIKRNGNIEQLERKNYYLIIDEINRGNISKIFGELITLIEEDKRDGLEVILPYSKQRFKIPSNLYIIGTMNSTDKSIALIDIALRRRFTFIKMMPNNDLVPELARDIFIKLNEGITNKLGEDYLIGHSYFMKIQDNDDLEFILEYKIKPLLEEYFYGDKQGYDEMMAIISDAAFYRE